ncbi:zwei Ig domain protein zig-8 isoform X1 [Halyomorpha halys]|uniref:zwei Ig domain protein zig-8 isoform X1 n=1 Tax=Halyomorpha halys TaxID=286706 RepID=UPI0006D4C980
MENIRCFFIISTLFVKLQGEFSNHDEDPISPNYTTLWDQLKLQTNPYLQDLQGHWSFNDTIDISKYEEFDHTRFQGSSELSMERMLDRMKEQERAERRRWESSKATQSPEEMPVFDTTLVTNVTSQLGATAFLHCRVKNLKNREVAWVRMRDWHILTLGMLTFSNDDRFRVQHLTDSDDWILMIKYVQKRDEGAYRCQVTTDAEPLTHVFNLLVAVPTADILGTSEIHIGQGSAISLVCVIENSPTPPLFVMWYHNDRMINYEEGESQLVQVVTEPGREKTHSQLLIPRASPRHSGKYSCKASNSEPDSVHVFVSTDGDNIAAIQRQGASDTKPCILLLLTLAFLLS